MIRYENRQTKAPWEGATVRKVDEGLGFRVLFSGDPKFLWQWQTGYDALASLTVMPGSHTLAFDPSGYESSVQQLFAFVQAFIAAFPCRIFDDATGTDITGVMKSFPSTLVSPENVSAVDLEKLAQRPSGTT